MSKLGTLFTIALFLSFLMIAQARSGPTLVENSSSVDTLAVTGGKSDEGEEISCEGAEGKEECLMRRTLAAHLDYIYTQHHKP